MLGPFYSYYYEVSKCSVNGQSMVSELADRQLKKC